MAGIESLFGGAAPNPFGTPGINPDPNPGAGLSNPDAGIADALAKVTPEGAQTPAGAAMEGYYRGKASDKQAKLDEYVNGLKQQALAIRQYKVQMEAAKKAFDYAGEQTGAMAVSLAPILMSDDVEASKGAFNQLATQWAAAAQSQGLDLKFLKAEPIGDTGHFRVAVAINGQMQEIDMSRDELLQATTGKEAQAQAVNTKANLKATTVYAKNAIDPNAVDSVPAFMSKDGKYWTQGADGTLVELDPGKYALSVGEVFNKGTGASAPANAPIPAMSGAELPSLPPVPGAKGDAMGVQGGAMPAPISSTELPPVDAAAKAPKMDGNVEVDEETNMPKSFSVKPLKEVPNIDPKRLKVASELTKELNGNKEIKDFQSGLVSFHNAISLAKDGTGASDIGLVFNIMKSFDPTSVVRESEFDTLEHAQNTLEQLKAKGSAAANVLGALINSDVYKGTTPKFTPETRSEFLKSAYSNLHGRTDSYLRNIGPALARGKIAGLPDSTFLAVDPEAVQYFSENSPNFDSLAGVGKTDKPKIKFLGFKK